MEDLIKKQQSIFGRWWTAIRRWFYPAWLIYETSFRFYDYSVSVINYFIEHQDFFGEATTQVLAIFCGLATFLLCTFYLTVPSSFTLYKFFKDEKSTTNPLIINIKRYF
jgi:hypothetical protein